MPATKRFAPNPVHDVAMGIADVDALPPGKDVEDHAVDLLSPADIIQESHSKKSRVHAGERIAVIPDSVETDVGAMRDGVSAGAHAAAVMIAGGASTTTVQPASRVTSPSSNRERFMKGFLPQRSCCNLDLVRSPPGTKFNLSAICIAVHPASENPARRYVQLADVTGTLGVTVWNDNVSKFSRDTIGRVITLSKAVMGNQNGKKLLTMNRDSSVSQIDDSHHDVATWWQSLLTHYPTSCGAVHDIADNNIITVSGVLGLVGSEVKMVNGVQKTLVSLHLVDSSGKVDVRSWNHSAEAFSHLAERPVLIRRVRVTSFAGTKLCELLDGQGSIIETSFKGQSALEQFWTS